MTSTLDCLPALSIDIGDMTQLERQAIIFSRLGALQPSQHLRLLCDHNPQMLREQFDAWSAGQYEWLDMKAGPLVWLVQITRIGKNASVPAGDSCCCGGACCG